MAGLSDDLLVLNAGSSNLKLTLFDGTATRELSEAEAEWSAGDAIAARVDTGLRHLLDGVERGRIGAVGHRIVHGGERYTSAMRIDESVKRAIADLVPLAPLHNPVALEAIAATVAALPGIPQIAAFDTAYHATLPPAAYLYPLPYEWYERWGIRRFGFHGLSHAYCAGRAAELLRQPVDALRTIVCHLGAGCSLTAVAGGRSVATTMGFTPLDGVPMATRPGSLDPGILTYLLGRGLLQVADLEDALLHRSGLYGLSGISSDVRDLLAARRDGDARARLALEVFVARIRAHIGALAVALGGLDVLVFTAGIGEHQPELRAEICQPLHWLGVALDGQRNADACLDADVASQESRVRVLVIRTREDLMVVRAIRHVLRDRPLS